MKINRKLVGNYHEYLINWLKNNSKEAQLYLNVALEEDDPEDFLVALKNVVEAHGITKTAKLAGLNRVSLYKMLSKKGNPSIFSLAAILKALGFEFRIERAHQTA